MYIYISIYYAIATLQWHVNFYSSVVPTITPIRTNSNYVKSFNSKHFESTRSNQFESIRINQFRAQLAHRERAARLSLTRFALIRSGWFKLTRGNE